MQRKTGTLSSLGLAAAFTGLLLAAPLLFAGAARADRPDCDGSPDQVRLDVTAAGIRSTEGQVTITVYPDDPDRFMAKGGKLLRVRVPASEPDTSTCIVLPAPGAYAFTVYHDENGNGKFDLTLIGMPDEGYGVSNDAPTVGALPRFKDARFEVSQGDNPMTIHISY